MRRYLVVVLILILAGAAGYYYYTTGRQNFSRDSSVYKAIPITAPFFFEISSVRHVNLNNPIIYELIQSGIGKQWFDFLQEADSLIGSDDHLSNSLLNNPFILTWGNLGRNQMIPLFIKKAESESRQKSLDAFINTYYPASDFSWHQKEYGQQQITEIRGKQSKESMFYSFTNGLLLVSPKSILIEQAILQMSTSGILKNPYFLEVNKMAGNPGIAFFINHERFDGFLGNILNRKVVEKSDEFGAAIRFQPVAQASKFKGYAGWSELDLKIGNENILVSGFTAADDSLNHFLSVFKDQQPVRFHAENVLPVNTSFFCSYSFSGKKAFFEQLENYYTHTADYYHREERMKRFDKGLKANTRSLFAEFVKDEVIVASGTIPVNPENKTVYFIIHTPGKAEAEEKVKTLITGYASRVERDAGEFITEFSVDSEVRFPIYRFPYPSLPGLWLGSPFTMAEAKYLTFYNSFMVFSNSEQGLHEYLRNMVLGTTLSNDIRYKKFRQNSSSKANVNVFIDVNKIFGYRNELLSEALLKPVNKNEESIRKFGMINWQVSHEKEAFLNSLALSFNPVAGEEAKTIWQSVVGNQLRIKPYIMKNHTDPSTGDIVFQDTQNNLVQVTGQGRVRWSIPLPGPVMSDIHQIDNFRNGKFQYLFNTKEKLYLLDRNGNNVAPFPIALKSAATNGVSVIDYDNNRNYRFFYAGDDKKVYAFDQEGKALKGWNFNTTEFEVTTPVQHFRIDGKDYVVFKDQSQIYILDRQGEPRITVPARFENSGNPLILNNNGKPKIVATDKYGKVYYIFFDGTTEEKKSGRFSENHFFTVDDLDGNNVPDFLFADGNELTVMDENGRKLFSRKFSNRLVNKPAIYPFSEGVKKVGITDAATNRIYLINADGKLHEGFPLQGNSGFSIGKISGNTAGSNLIVGSEGGMLFNYNLN
jgi:hypothetical protein